MIALDINLLRPGSIQILITLARFHIILFFIQYHALPTSHETCVHISQGQFFYPFQQLRRLH